MLPVYNMDLSLAFPEIRSVRQTTNGCDRPAAGLVLAVAYLLSGNKFTGNLQDLTMQEFYGELREACLDENLDLKRLFKWADSILLPPEVTLPHDQFDAVPVGLTGPGFDLHMYQREVAAWLAHRMGAVAALGTGTGKTACATAAAIAAKRLGKCSGERLVVVCPVNAFGAWEEVQEDLEREFRYVVFASCDSLHHYVNMDSSGGAIIYDEIHKLKNYDTAIRSGLAFKLRTRFEWGLGLTATLLHTGCEGIMTIMDMAVPGLSRYLDKWDFGYACNAVMTQMVKGVGERRKLGIPGKTGRELLEKYLARGVRSLSFESEEVTTCVQVPGQERVLEDTWAKPQWVKDLFSSWDGEKQDTPYMWGPEMDWQTYTGATAVALMNERQEFLSEYLLEIFDRGVPRYVDDYDEDLEDEELQDFMIIDDVRKVIEKYRPLEEKLKGYLTDDTVNEMREMVDEIVEADPDNRYYKPLPKLLGLPSFQAVFWEMRVDGRWDRIVERCTEEQPNGLKKVTYRYRYAEGCDKRNPGLGPKLSKVIKWLEENLDEPLVIGAARKFTLNVIAKELENRDIGFEVIRGGVSAKKRKERVRRFQKGNVRVMLLQQVAGSESVTLTRAATSILVEHDLSPIVYTQFLGRTRRVGQKRECMHIDYAFNEVQAERIMALRRGDAFDAETRASIEESIQYQLARMNGPKTEDH